MLNWVSSFIAESTATIFEFRQLILCDDRFECDEPIWIAPFSTGIYLFVVGQNCISIEKFCQQFYRRCAKTQSHFEYNRIKTTKCTDVGRQPTHFVFIFAHARSRMASGCLRRCLRDVELLNWYILMQSILTLASSSCPTLRKAMYCLTPSIRFWNSTLATFILDIIEPILPANLSKTLESIAVGVKGERKIIQINRIANDKNYDKTELGQVLVREIPSSARIKFVATTFQMHSSTLWPNVSERT